MTKEKILLATDKFKIELIEREISKSVEQLNHLIGLSERVCNTDFDKKQRDAIRDEGLTFIREYFKPQWRFENASEEFNMQAIGMDLSPLIKYAEATPPVWRQFPIEQNTEGIFELAREPEQIKSCRKYAETDRQIDAYEMAVAISNLINSAVEDGFISKSELIKVIRLGIVTVNSKETRAIPNLDRIARI